MNNGDTDVTRLPASARDAPRTLGAYQLVQSLGEGGMGEVWLAQQHHPVRRQLAIKILKAGMDTARVVARFEAERQALAVMDHPSIAKVFDGGTTPEGRPYFVMEYVRGESLTAYCDRYRLSLAQRLELFVQLCDGVQHAHQKGIIHRDLKPSNVLVAAADDRPMLRIIDFGIAKAIAQPLTEQPLYTEVGTFIGTPEYMSPEQADMSAVDIDTRSDVYSLGVILYELLAGALPFDRDTLREGGLEAMLRTIREKVPPRPSTRVGQPGSEETAERRATQPARLKRLLHGELDWIVLKALEKDRTRRYPTANALSSDVRRYLVNEPVSAGPPTASYQLKKFVRRHRAGVAAGAAVAALLVVFSATVLFQSRRIAQERDRANQEAATATQVSNFLGGLFRASDPRETRGDTLTVRQVLDRGARELEVLGAEPEVQARLQTTMGDVYTALGAYDAAAPLLERSVATHRRLLGDDHRDTLAAVHLLANAYWYTGRLADAERLYVDVVGRRSRLYGDHHRDTLKAQFDLASVYTLQRREAEAESLQRQVLARQEAALGTGDLDTIESRNNLVILLHRQQRFADALPLATQALDGKRQLLGDAHPSTLISLHNLAFTYEQLERLDDAGRLYRECLEMRRHVLGPGHISTATSELALGRVYAKQGRDRDAEALVRSGLETSRRVRGEDDARTREAFDLLGRLERR